MQKQLKKKFRKPASIFRFKHVHDPNLIYICRIKIKDQVIGKSNTLNGRNRQVKILFAVETSQSVVHRLIFTFWISQFIFETIKPRTLT